MSTGLGVSFVVTAHDAGPTLARTIAALLSQELDLAFEIVIVDDRSSDDTYALASHLAEHDGRLRILRVSSLPEGVTSRQAALDLAVGASTGRLVLIVDADAVPPPQWAKRMVEALASADLVASSLVFVPAENPRGGWLAALQTVDAAHYLGVCELLGMARQASGVCFGAAGFRRSLYDAVGGFSGLGLSLVEDLAFARAAQRAGARVRVLWGSPVAVHGVGSLGALVQRARRVSTTGGSSLLATALGLWGLSLIGLAIAAVAGVLPAAWVAARYGAGLLWTGTQTVRAGSWRSLPLVPVYEAAAIAVALVVLCTPSRSRWVQWGGVEYVRQRGSWMRAESFPVR